MIYKEFNQIPENRYKLILCDPPWQYRNLRTGGSMSSGSSVKYKTMPLDEIKELPIRKIADKNSVLFLWVTVPLLPEGLEVMKSWGYKYKTSLFWKKVMSLGMGFWYRGQVEMLLLGIRGKVNAFGIQKRNIIQAKVREHSRKPDEFYEWIEASKLEPRIELFARFIKRDGWDVYGDEL